MATSLPRRIVVGGYAVLPWLSAAACAGALAPEDRAATPRDLLGELLAAKKAGDLDRVRELVYPWRPYAAMDAPGAQLLAAEFVVREMARARTAYTGDWSYSDEALAVLVRHGDEFGPVPPARIPHAGQRELGSAPRPTSWCYWEQERCRVWLARADGGWRLWFWEGLNHLLANDG